jgi:hypothetical protein
MPIYLPAYNNLVETDLQNWEVYLGDVNTVMNVVFSSWELLGCGWLKKHVLEDSNRFS